MLRLSPRIFRHRVLSTSYQPLQSRRQFFRIIGEYERGLFFTLGKLTGIKNPGFRMSLPFIQEMVRVDMRWVFQTLEPQDVITADNISVKIDSVISSRIVDTTKSVCAVKDINNSLKELISGKLREIISQAELNDLLHNREKISTQLRNSIIEGSQSWGIELGIVIIKDIKFDESMIRAMAKKAEALRDREAKIIAAETESTISRKFLEAAKIFSQNPISLELRRLDTLLNMSREKGNMTIIIPNDILGKKSSYPEEKSNDPSLRDID